MKVIKFPVVKFFCDHLEPSESSAGGLGTKGIISSPLIEVDPIWRSRDRQKNVTATNFLSYDNTSLMINSQLDRLR